MSATQPSYLLGSSPAEVQRLERQSERLAEPTRLLLQRAGLRPGMRVLDLGTGIGDVALLAAELVGPRGSVLGVDRSPEVLAVAEYRRARRGLAQVHFQEGDVTTFRAEGPFDAVVGRLILLHLADPLAAVRHHAAALAPGGRWVALDYDCEAMRAEPPTPLVTRAVGWILGGFRFGRADPAIGARLGSLLTAGGLAGVQTLGLQEYLAPGDPYGPAALTAVVRALLPAIAGAGLATAREVAVDSLAERVAAELRKAGATLVPPTLACAWGVQG
jgi:SAM-dependent methyltransferase